MESGIVNRAGDVGVRVAALVDAYSRRVYPAVLEQHRHGSVSSPLGVWLLLAACASASGGEDRGALELVLGCSAEEASELLAAFMAAPPPALKAAIAVWVRDSDSSDKVAAWLRGLPASVESGLMPSQQEANAWADTNTDGLIGEFPLSIDALTRIVLASALATRVSWERTFEVVPAADYVAPTSPWRGSVELMLWDPRPRGRAMLTDTRAAGIVAVHYAVAREDLTVVSVSAAPDVARLAVLQAAHEVAAFARQRSAPPEYSLFELPVGAGHSWQIREHETRTVVAGERVQRIAGVSLPAWHVRSQLDLKKSQAFGTAPALEALRQSIGPRPGDRTEAAQTTVASFTCHGFEAAAITAFAVLASLARPPGERGVERAATLRFDHPYAAIAVAGRAPFPEHAPGPSFTGLPLFSAWVNDPEEADGDPKTGPTPQSLTGPRPGG